MPRIRRGRHALPGDQPQQRGEQHADQRAERVHDQVVDVEDPVRAGEQAVDAGQLGELDEQGDEQAGQHDRHRAAPEQVAAVHAERHEQADVEQDLGQRAVVQQGGEAALALAPDVVEELERVQLRDVRGVARAPLRGRVRGGQQRVRPDRQRVDHEREGEQGVAPAELTASSVGPRQVRDREQQRDQRPAEERQLRGDPVIGHPKTLAGPRGARRTGVPCSARMADPQRLRWRSDEGGVVR
jgi:hypothetical protein